jgi:hypothetical protein
MIGYVAVAGLAFRLGLDRYRRGAAPGVGA